MTENLHDENMTNHEAISERVAEGQINPYRHRRARDPLVLLLAMMLFALLAIAGIVVAVTGEYKDPDVIALPIHKARSLHQEESGLATVPSTEAIDEEFAEDMILDRAELPASKIEDFEPQEESPLDLNPMTPVPEFSPQSILLNRPLSHPEKLTATAQKKTLENITHREPIALSTKNPLVVIVIDDMGMNHRNSQRMTDLPAIMTLAYLPYAEKLATQTEKAFAKGHELIVHMPMEPTNIAHNNPGPNALLTHLSAQENLMRLTHNLDQFEKYIGLNNHMGSKMTADAAQMRPIMRAIKEKNLWFLDSKTIGHSVAARIAEEEGVPFAVRDVFLDNVHEVNYVLGQLRETERIALSKGYAIAIGHPHDATIAALQQWIPQARQRGVSIVPLSALIAKRFPNEMVPRYARMRDVKPVTQETVHQENNTEKQSPKS